MTILVIETSTTSAKVMLYDTKKGIINIETENYKKEYNDTETHDADGVFFQTVCLAKKTAAGKKIDMIALSTTWHSLMLCQKNMSAATRVYTWASSLAKNAADEMRKDKMLAEKIYQKTGCPINASYPLAKIRALRQNGFKIEDYKIVCYGSYCYHKLTGKNYTSLQMASGTALLNILSKEYDEEMLEIAMIKKEDLPEIKEYNHTEMLTKEAADMLGIKECPVLIAHPDGMLNQVGANALGENIMTFSVGTSAAIRLSSSKAILKDASVWCYLAPHSYITGAATSGACSCVDWIKNSMFDKDITYKDLEKDVIFKEDLPIFMPFIFGERNPSFANESGSFFGIKSKHDKTDLYISVLEGTLFNIYQCYKIIKNIYGKPSAIKLSGGILNSDFWSAMCSDIFGEKMEKSSLKQISILGALFIALQTLGATKSLDEIKLDKTMEIYPDMNKHEKYENKFERYLSFYKKMK